MRKIILVFALVTAFAATISAQNCRSLFPTDKGTELVTKNYDPNKKLMSSFIYTVLKSYGNDVNNMVDMSFRILNSTGEVIDQGLLVTSCDGTNFQVKLTSKGLPIVQYILAGNTELVGNFLDYPDIFADNTFTDNTFKMNPGKFTIYTKDDKKDFITVDIKDRQYEKIEKVKTPAGEFDAYKITFSFEVYNNEDKKTRTFKGIEWLTPGTGIVRTETYNMDNNLLTYSELTTLKKQQ